MFRYLLQEQRICVIDDCHVYLPLREQMLQVTLKRASCLQIGIWVLEKEREVDIALGMLVARNGGAEKQEKPDPVMLGQGVKVFSGWRGDIHGGLLDHRAHAPAFSLSSFEYFEPLRGLFTQSARR
jgi:hypothetical protein